MDEEYVRHLLRLANENEYGTPIYNRAIEKIRRIWNYMSTKECIERMIKKKEKSDKSDIDIDKYRSLIDKIDACDIALSKNVLYATEPTSFIQLKSNWMATIPEECYPEIKEVISKWRYKFKQQLTEL